MREILFKAKRIDNGEWVEGFYCKRKHYCFDKRTDELKTVIMTEFSSGGFVCYEVNPETICQYTGLTDKNGNKIWENDIVKTYTSNGNEWRISKIVWADHSLNIGWCIEDIKILTEYSGRLFKVGFDVNDAEKCEVIGNIFDNPELIGE